MVAETMKSSTESEQHQDYWDGYITVGKERIRVKDMSDILATRFAFLSGARTEDGSPVLSFPDSRVALSQDDYQLYITYLLHIPPNDNVPNGFVIVADRRSDKWSSVRNLLSQISSFFPGLVRVALVLKPEGVLQRALEVGYRSLADSCSFKVILCETSNDLCRYLGPELLSVDFGGFIKYNHLEWVQHRMDIEKMKSSATVIAQSLNEFGRCLKETEMPNDAETTERILEMQRSEKDAIKEDFRIAIRKGTSLLGSVRQLEEKPEACQLSPTRFHNVTAIERMLVQLEDTERSFDIFWEKHERRLMNCLELRLFEDSFRKLQTSFAKHMLYLEEHREVGESIEKAKMLATAHEEYASQAQEDVREARKLRDMGSGLVVTEGTEGAASLLPKCDELARMADALSAVLSRRTAVLALSQQMHSEISQANSWCRKGVNLLSDLPIEITSSAAAAHVSKMDEFLEEGSRLQSLRAERVFAQLDTLSRSSGANNLILLTTTETSTLLAQVSERIEDIRRMGQTRRDALQRLAGDAQPKPVQVVSPEKINKFSSPKRDCEVEESECCEGSTLETATPSPSAISIEEFVVAELVNTERSYLSELESILHFYVEPFESIEGQAQVTAPFRGRSHLIFGNLRELVELHSHLLPDLLSSSSPSSICRLLLSHRHRFFALYLSYCQNKSSYESIRRQFLESTPMLAECQKRAGHLLPLSAYLLKPVQRITKYQLLLRELLRHCRPDAREDVEAALRAMLQLLAQINAAIHQLHISGFNGDLRLLGPLRIQTECDVFTYSRKKPGRRGQRAQRRHLFLFDGGILFCKKRQQMASVDHQEYYEHKMCIPSVSLCYEEHSRTGNSTSSTFDVWDETKNEAFAIEPLDHSAKHKWMQRLQAFPSHEETRSRPKSWTSLVSTESTSSALSAPSETADTLQVDRNGNKADIPDCLSSGEESSLLPPSPESSSNLSPTSIPPTVTNLQFS